MRESVYYLTTLNLIMSKRGKKMFIEIKLNKSTIYLTPEEINRLLLKDISLFKEAVNRGKAFSRANQHRQQCERKFTESEGHLFSKRLEGGIS